MTYWSKVTFLTDDPLKQNGWWQIFQSFPTEDYRKPIGSTKAGMEKCKRHRKGSSRPFLTLIRHQSRLPQLKDRSSSDELTWNLSYAWSNFTKTVQKRTSKEENTKNHCSNPQCRKNLCNSFIRDWNVSEKKLVNYFLFSHFVRQILQGQILLLSWQLYTITYPWSLTWSLTTTSESEDREEASLDTSSHFNHWPLTI